MNNQPIAYTGLFLVVAGFLLAIAMLAFGNNIQWLRDSREGVLWGTFAMCIVGSVLGFLNWKTAPGKVAGCFGGILVLLFLALMLTR